MRILKYKRNLLIPIIISVLVMLTPMETSASFSVDVKISKQTDGASCGEVWLGDKLFWRLLILPDGVRPASGGAPASKTTFLIPAIVDGMFVINIR